jgi:hypothetical protein
MQIIKAIHSFRLIALEKVSFGCWLVITANAYGVIFKRQSWKVGW